jgi:hypothetical protein
MDDKLKVAKQQADDAEREVRRLEREANRERNLEKLKLFPAGWEERLAAAFIASVKSGDDSGSCELAAMSYPDQPIWATVSFHTTIIAMDYSESFSESKQRA